MSTERDVQYIVDIETAYKSIASAIALYPMENWKSFQFSARFISAPLLLNKLLKEDKITLEQHSNMYDQLNSSDHENWLVVFILLQTFKDVLSR